MNKIFHPNIDELFVSPPDAHMHLTDCSLQEWLRVSRRDKPDMVSYVR